MQNDETQRVLYFQYSLRSMNVAELEGAYRYARSHGFVLQAVHYDLSARERRLSSVCCDADVKNLVSFWRPAGCIVECGGNACPFDAVDFMGKPLVCLDCNPEVARNDVVCVCSDSADIAACAARELLSLDLPVYAYLSYPRRYYWSLRRGEAFAAYVVKNGKRFLQFEHRDESVDSETLHLRLVGWVKRLPKPCGVFVANDTMANAFVRAVSECGFSIPQDFAVVSVDNDAQICENTAVSLTSIAVANERAGYLAMEYLAKRIKGTRIKSRVVAFGVDHLHRRASSNPFRNADVRVLKAVEFIRRHATEGISPLDVVAEMGCSRRLADLRFREVVGRSILDEIHSVRLAKVKECLKRPTVDMLSIPDFCGYGSIADLRRVFKKRVGMTMRRFSKLCSEQ
jgi:LacI family transcriptional regulator